MSKVSLEQATKEVGNWLDFKKISERRREPSKDVIESLIDDITEGTLVLEDDFSFTHTLRFPLGENGITKLLKYKPRLDVRSKSMYLKKDKINSGTDVYVSTIAALTEQSTGVVMSMDTEDYNTATSIAVFFI